MVYWKNLKKCTMNIGMLVAVAVSCVILLRVYFQWGYITDTKYIDMLLMITLPLGMSSYLPFACIFPAMPYALSYLEEKKSGYCIYVLARMKHSRYIFNKILFTGISGGLAVAVPISIAFLTASIFGYDVTAATVPDVFKDTMWGAYAHIWGGRFVLLMRALLSFFFGAFWAEMTLTVSLLIKNRYAAFILPFVIYQLAWVLIPTGFNTMILLRPECTADTPLAIPYVIGVVYVGAVCMVNGFIMRRDLREENH